MYLLYSYLDPLGRLIPYPFLRVPNFMAIGSYPQRRVTNKMGYSISLQVLPESQRVPLFEVSGSKSHTLNIFPYLSSP